MKTAIVVFSPTGNTLKVAKMLKENLKNNGIQAQLLDITSNKKLFHEKNYRNFLNENEKVTARSPACWWDWAGTVRPF